MKKSLGIGLLVIMFLMVSVMVRAEVDSEGTVGEAPALGYNRITQDMITSGQLSLAEIRSAGERVFTTPFNWLDGLGDGPIDEADPASPGGRPTLQGNGMFLRFNGLDSQTCFECHNILSSADIPATFAVGGAGGVAASAFPRVLAPDIADNQGNGFAEISGRFINPPAIFGAGGIELLAKEMTAELQAARRHARSTPGVEVQLASKNVDFGSIVCGKGGDCDAANVEGIDDDLVVRPFGRKGEFATVRAFDVQALQFHHGMQPTEVVGEDVDADGDDVVNEITVGDVSAMAIFETTLRKPRQAKIRGEARRGRILFNDIGCASCHIAELTSESRFLAYSFPEEETDPSANIFYRVNLSKKPAHFKRTRRGGIEVPLFADLKRHDMGPDLAESTGGDLDAMFTTARLWGVADTAPYLHDGRATTLTEAILFHGGEAQDQRDRFDALPDEDAKALLAFLRTLRTPRNEVR